MLKHRLRSGFALAGALLAALYFLPATGHWAVSPLIVLMIVCAMALKEFYAMLRSGDIPHLPKTGIIGGIILLAATWWSHKYSGNSAIARDIEAIVLFGVAASALTLQMFRPTLDRALQSIASTLLGFVYVAWLLNFLNKLLFEFGYEEGRMLVFYLALVVKMTDVGAFFIGCKIGGKKFFPKISPAKTWSGVLGGMLTGIVCSVVAMHFLSHMVPGLQIIDAIALGIILSAMGILGDLIESLIKRAAGVKDSSTMIQGMGGLLDILDSLMFAAPFLYVYLRLFVDTGA